MAEYFKMGYVGNPNLKASDFAKYSMQELKNMMKSQAKRLNTRLSSLEKNHMTGAYAYETAKRWAFDNVAGTHERSNVPRFETRVNVYDDAGLWVRDRTRDEIVEQLIKMGKWESYSTSTVSGVMAVYENKYEYLKQHGFNGTLEDYINTATTDAHATIQAYYGSTTADYIISTYGETAAQAFIDTHPECFTADCPIVRKNNEGMGGALESIFKDWYEANWQTTADAQYTEEDFLNEW